MGAEVYSCKRLFARRTQVESKPLGHGGQVSSPGRWPDNPFNYRPKNGTMKTVKHPQLSQTRAPKIDLPRSRRAPASANLLRQDRTTSVPTVDPEPFLKVLRAFG